MSGNTADGNQLYGIHLVTSGSNTVSDNTFDNNLKVGVLVDADAADNIFSRNTALNNGSWDLEDNSIGTATAGTAEPLEFGNTASMRGPVGLG